MKPIFCNYYITLRCNSKCKFCNIWSNKKKPREQSLEEIESNLKNLKKLGVKIIDFTGGEPLLYPQLVEALTLAKTYKFFTTVTTNCSLYPKFASKLNGIVDVLQFSMESVDENIHNEIRGIDCYKKVIESIKIAKQIKQKVYLIYTVTDYNIENLPEMIDFAQKSNCILVLNPCFNYFNNEKISPKLIHILYNYFNEKYVVLDLAYVKLIIAGGNKIQNPICRAVSSTVVISPDNYLLLPCFHHHFEKIKIEDNLTELYSSDKVSNIKKQEGRYNFCKNCTIYCYMRGSLYKKYFYLSLKSGLKYVIEYLRKQY